MVKHLFLSVLEISISASLPAVLLLILSPWLSRQYAAKWKYYTWSVLFLRLVIPFHIPLPRPAAASIPLPLAADAVTAAESLPVPIYHNSAKAAGISLLDVTAAVWFFMAVCFLLIHILSFLYYKSQVIKYGTFIGDSRILQQIHSVKTSLQISTDVPVIAYKDAPSPMVIGFFRPVFVLPDSTYTEKELYFILKHEFIHIRRHDIYLKFLYTCAAALHWFNPAVYIMRKEACIDMELSCDERVVCNSSYADRKAYTDTLLSALDKHHKKSASFTTQFYGGTNIMKKRFQNILSDRKKRNGFILLLAILILTAAANIFTGLSHPGKESAELAAYIKDFSGSEIALDFAEYITDDDTKRKRKLISELNLTEGDGLYDGNFADGYYIYNPQTDYVTYPVSDDAVYQFFDWGRDFADSDLPEDLFITTSDSNDFSRYLNTYENAKPGMPFFIELKDGKVIRITEKPMA